MNAADMLDGDEIPEPRLCIYCATHPALPDSDYCGTECVINASNEGA